MVIYIMDQQATKFLETQILNPLNPFKSVFFIWIHGEEKLKKFMEDSNSSHLLMTLSSLTSLIENFIVLDLKVISANGKLITIIYSKPTDCHQYLHYKSSYPEHTKRSIIHSQTLRVKRVCSQENVFKEHTSKLKSWFLKQGYPENIVDNEMKKVFGDNSK